MRNPVARFRRSRASRANERGRELERLGRTSEAIEEYARAASIDPDWGAPRYNLGLVYKYAGEWELSLEHNLRATRLAPDDQAGWWNLGIAATALGRHDVARAAWRGAGIDVPDGDGPVAFPCGSAPIRLNPDANAEVVWADRLDPARACVYSIPLPESGFRFGDTVLNDGAGTGWRRSNGRDVPVFNCLQLLAASRFSTWVTEIEIEDEDATIAESLARLEGMARERELAAEDWTSSLEWLCKACSEGKPHSDHEHPPRELGRRRRVAIAATDEETARRLIEDWRIGAGPLKARTTVMELELALGSPDAGNS
jgi:tetratricopeptide (TPR) repeat protein